MEGLGSLLLFAGLFYFLMRFGCGAHMMHGHGKHKDADDDSTKSIDPVCKMAVDTEQGYGEMYQGKLLRFCSKSCLDKFDADPERYIEKDQGDTQ